MPKKTRKVLGIGFALLGLLLTLGIPSTLLAQDDQQDPPGRVARLNYSIGSVSFQPGGTGDWVQAVPNRPLTSGDNLWADKDSRAELHIGSTAIRMDSETSMTFLDLDDRTTQIRLSQGSVIVRVRHLDDEDHFEIDTPNSAFTVQRTGEYRVDVNADGSETDVTVWHGRGEVVGGGESFVVVADQRARFTGTDQLNHDIEQVPNRDDFDEFAFSRDQHEDRAESANYISPEMTGYEDLDDYGRWHYAAGYGPVWTPMAVAPGWAPYRFGHWVWVAPWGWTWVEDEPWGFAPFHYGRWAFVDDGWCWVPGPAVVRPVYAPALVAFVGGGGFAVGIGAGVAWFPLAPREVFVPWYRTSPTYVNNVNITNTRVNVTQVTNVYNTYNTTNITRVTYVNQRVTNAVTVVNHETFVNARPVASNLTKVDQRQIAEAPVTRTIPVQPQRASVIGAGKPVSIHPPEPVLNRPVVATRSPAPPRAALEPSQGMNVRTENPAEARPAGNPQTEPAMRGNENPRSAEPARPAPSNVPRPGVENNTPRPGAENNTARPGGEVNQPRPGAENNTPRPGSMPESKPVPRPSMGEGGHPLVRPAPPMQNRPEVQKSEEQKFQAWQAQRPRAEAPHPPERAPQPPHEERGPKK